MGGLKYKPEHVGAAPHWFGAKGKFRGLPSEVFYQVVGHVRD